MNSKGQIQEINTVLPIQFCSFNVTEAMWFTAGQQEQVSLQHICSIQMGYHC